MSMDKDLKAIMSEAMAEAGATEEQIRGDAGEPAPVVPKEEPDEPEVKIAAEKPTDTPKVQPGKSKSEPAPKPEVSAEPKQVTTETVKAAGKDVVIDYTNREKIKDAFLKAEGMRKFQQERDVERKAHAETKKAAKVDKDKLDILEKAWGDRGIEGIIDCIEGAREKFDKLIESKVAHATKYRDADEVTRRQMDYESRLEAEREARRLLEKRVKERDENDSRLKDENEKKALVGMFSPAFNQYRFDGKLGDKETEELWNESLWEKSKKILAKIPEESELTAEMVEGTFRRVAETMGRSIKVNVDKQVTSAVKEKKKGASAAAASIAAAGASKANMSKEDEFNKNPGSYLAKLMDGTYKPE